MAPHRKDIEYAESLAKVVRAGLGATQMSGIQNILESISREIRARFLRQASERADSSPWPNGSRTGKLGRSATFR